MLNPAQQKAFEAILEGRSIFLTGSGGTGKSFLLGKVYDAVSGIRALALTALTGCASLLLHPRAKTLHSWAGIGLGDSPAHVLVETVRVNRRAAMRWRMTDILVIDEVSMLTPELFEKLDVVGRAIRRCERPFGGLQIVFVGDFYQLPPVSAGDSKFAFESPLWKTLGLEIHELTEIVRQKDPAFQKVLGEARRGRLTPESIQILQSRIGLDYSGLQIQPSMVFTRRAQVHDLNRKHFDSLVSRSAGKTYTYAVATLGSKNADAQKAIAKLDKVASYMPELTLAVGAQVMLLINDPENKLTNGSRGVVVGFEEDSKPSEVKPEIIPLVKFCGGQVLPIKRHVWTTEIPGVSRTQLPLTLAYAVTIHKTQGSTLDCALIDVGERTFEYGQAYVALSRVKSLEALYIHDFHPGAFKAHPKVKAFYATCQAPEPSAGS